MHKLCELYRIDQLPIFQNRMYETADEAVNCPKGDMLLVEDSLTGLVYNSSFQPELMNYDGNYQNEQANSPLFKRHLDAVAEIIDRSIGQESIVEVGCGKGFFVEMLQAKGWDISGFDPTYEGNNPNIQNHNFEPGLGIRANGLVLRHVLEHIQDPFNFLEQLKESNGGEGKLYIEVPCFDWICKHRAWFDIFYEHVNYFRLSDFFRMFGTVIDSGRLFGDQYLFVVVDIGTLRQPEIDPNDRVYFPDDFTLKIAEQEITESNEISIWGGASKGVIFALLKLRAGQSVGTVIDINPAKQGKYLPGTGLLVQSPDEAMTTLSVSSTIYVMNSNYLQEIKDITNNKFTYIECEQ